VLSTFPSLSSTCGIKISHSGAVNSGWETTYYHLENVQKYSGAVNQNEKIGVIANTLAEAICVGGSSTGPHVHFSLKYNGAYFPINGTALSGWVVHAGRWSYDTDAAYMWLERAGVKKYPSSPTYDVILSEAPPALPVVSSIVRAGINPSSSTSVNFTVTFSKSITGVNTAAPFSDFILSTTGVTGTSITSVTGSGSTYTVTVNTGSGNGTIRLDVVDDNSIVDSASNRLGGAAAGDGNFTTGEAYTINKDGTVTDTWAVQVSPSVNISQLAAQFGAQNLGQIGSLSNFYLFHVSGSDSQAKVFADLLAANPQVLWFEQQVARGQSKRENTDPVPPSPVQENLADAATVPTAIDGMIFQDKSSEVSSINTLPVTSSPEPIQIAATITESYPTTTRPFTPSPVSTQTNILPITSPIPTQTTITQRLRSSIPTRPVQPAKIAALPNEPSVIPTTMIRSANPSTESENTSSDGGTEAPVLSIAALAIGSVLFSIRRKK